MKEVLRKLVFGLLVVLFISAGYENVLCQSRNGHFAIEPSFHNHCRHDEKEHRSNPAEYYSRLAFVEPCYPCVDMQFEKNLLFPLKIKNTLPHFSSPWQAVFVEHIVFSNNPYGTYDTFSFFTPLRSVILRT